MGKPFYRKNFSRLSEVLQFHYSENSDTLFLRDGRPYALSLRNPHHISVAEAYFRAIIGP